MTITRHDAAYLTLGAVLGAFIVTAMCCAVWLVWTRRDRHRCPKPPIKAELADLGATWECPKCGRGWIADVYRSTRMEGGRQVSEWVPFWRRKTPAPPHGPWNA